MAGVYHPQLARLVKHPPDGDGWLHEVKYDGYRIGCLVRNGSIALISRNGKDWTAALPEIARAAQALGTRDALLDGEAAVVLSDGRTSFQALQNAFDDRAARGRLVYFVFDILRPEGKRLERRPLEERKRALLALLGKPRERATIRYSEHVVGRGADVLAEACRLGLEGIVSKRRDAPYEAGRGEAWVKTKCVLRQEFVIGGFTDPEGTRQGIGALLAGYYDGTGRLVFAGKVGTGFPVRTALDLRRRLDAIERRESPFTPPPAGGLGRRAHWVEPRLVAEVAFTEWTGEGKIRHPSFQGLRLDKDPRVVRREAPAAAPPAGPEGLRANPGPRGGAPRASVVVADVAITHPERVVYPDAGLTKLDVARYYERVADWMLPHVSGRPLTLVRCPDGTGGTCFYMKHSHVWAPGALRRVPIREKKKIGEYLVADTASALVGLAQMGVLEVHTWNSRVDRVEHPDRLVLDIDPGEHVGWPLVVEAARMVRRLLEDAGLESFPKTTGGKGLHVVVPLTPAAGWPECLAFARGLAIEMERREPERYTTQFAKTGRKRKLLIDYLRNNRTNTSIAAFSTRARAGAPVSAPLRWTELTPSLDPAAFTVRSIEQRLRRLKKDPWAGYGTCRQRLPKRAPWPQAG